MNWEIAKEVAVAVGSVIAVVVVSFKSFKKQLDTYLNEKKENIPSKIIRQSDIDDKILTRMEQIKEVLGADRILVFDFHNGEHFANGRSALRMSASYEVTKYGTERMQSRLQRLPLSILPNLIKELLDKGYFAVDNFENFKNMQPEYSICASLKMKSIYNFIIKNEFREPIGFVSIGFHDVVENIDKELTSKLIWFIEEKISYLAEEDNKK